MMQEHCYWAFWEYRGELALVLSLYAKPWQTLGMEAIAAKCQKWKLRLS